MIFHPLRCDHHHVCWMVHSHNKCINDAPSDIPCCFDTRLHSNATTERGKVLGELEEIDSQSLDDVQVELDQERLYRQFGQDKVLDAGIALIQKRIDGIYEVYKGETNEKLTARLYSVADGMDEAIKMLKSLRTAPEQL